MTWCLSSVGKFSVLRGEGRGQASVTMMLRSHGGRAWRRLGGSLVAARSRLPMRQRATIEATLHLCAQQRHQRWMEAEWSHHTHTARAAPPAAAMCPPQYIPVIPAPSHFLCRLRSHSLCHIPIAILPYIATAASSITCYYRHSADNTALLVWYDCACAASSLLAARAAGMAAQRRIAPRQRRRAAGKLAGTRGILRLFAHLPPSTCSLMYCAIPTAYLPSSASCGVTTTTPLLHLPPIMMTSVVSYHTYRTAPTPQPTTGLHTCLPFPPHLSPAPVPLPLHTPLACPTGRLIHLRLRAPLACTGLDAGITYHLF